jgi:hypothetical protein
MVKMLSALVLLCGLSFLGGPSLMAADDPTTPTTRKDGDDQHHHRHHRKHRKHHHCRHHKHKDTDQKPGTNSGTNS